MKATRNCCRLRGEGTGKQIQNRRNKDHLAVTLLICPNQFSSVLSVYKNLLRVLRKHVT